MRDNEFTKILGWPGYRVFRHEIDETAMTLRLWVRRKRGDRKLICSGCGRKSTGYEYLGKVTRVEELGDSQRGVAVLGRTTAGTLRLSEDSRGLKFECDLPDTTAGRDTYESV